MVGCILEAISIVEPIIPITKAHFSSHKFVKQMGFKRKELPQECIHNFENRFIVFALKKIKHNAVFLDIDSIIC